MVEDGKDKDGLLMANLKKLANLAKIRHPSIHSMQKYIIPELVI